MCPDSCRKLLEVLEAKTRFVILMATLVHFGDDQIFPSLQEKNCPVGNLFVDIRLS